MVGSDCVDLLFKVEVAPTADFNSQKPFWKKAQKKLGSEAIGNSDENHGENTENFQQLTLKRGGEDMYWSKVEFGEANDDS